MAHASPHIKSARSASSPKFSRRAFSVSYVYTQEQNSGDPYTAFISGLGTTTSLILLVASGKLPLYISSRAACSRPPDSPYCSMLPTEVALIFSARSFRFSSYACVRQVLYGLISCEAPGENYGIFYRDMHRRAARASRCHSSSLVDPVSLILHLWHSSAMSKSALTVP